MSDSVRPQRWQRTRLPRPWDSPGKNTGVGCHFLLQCMKVKSESEVAQSCPALSNPMDCSLPGSSIHGIFQARVLEWGATAFSKVVLVVKNPPANAGDAKDAGSAPWSGRLPWRRKWPPTPVFLPGASQGRGSPVGCCLWGRTESDTTEAT